MRFLPSISGLVRLIGVLGICAGGSGCLGGGALAQCIDYPSYLHREDGLSVWPGAERVAASGEYAYLGGERLSYLAVVGMQGIHPELLGTVDLPRGASGMAARGSYVYVVDRWGQYPWEEYGDLHVIDVSDPANPALVTSLGLSSYGMDIVISGSYAFVACYGHGVEVFDLSDPELPANVGSVWISGAAYSVACSGSFLYVGEEAITEGGLFAVVDVTVPDTPEVVSLLATPGVVNAVAASGGLACAAEGEDGVQIIDVADPSNPVILSGASTPSPATDLAFLGSAVFAGYTNGARGGLLAIDLSSPADPQVVGRVDTPGGTQDLIAVGDRIYASSLLSGLEVIAAGNRQSPAILGSLGPPLLAGNSAIAGVYAFVAGAYAGMGENGFAVVDLADPANPHVEGTAELSGALGSPLDVAAAESYVFVSSYYGGILHVLDVSVPSEPQIVAEPDLGASMGLALSGAIACTGGGSGLLVLDVADPPHPQVLGSTALPFGLWDVAISDSLACVIGQEGFVVVDISDPHNPVVRGSVEAPGSSVAVAGGFAYTGEQVLDIRDPSSPRVVATLAVPGHVWGLSLSDHFLYAVGYFDGMQVIDVEDPLDPITIGSIPLSSGGWGVSVSGDLACVGLGENGLAIAPEQCEGPGGVPALGAALNSLSKLPLSVFPNPSFGTASIRFSLGEGGSTGWVQAMIHDVTGRRVRELGGFVRGAGRHEILWDGRDGAGKEATPGIYLVRLSTPQGSGSTRVVRLR